MTTLADKIEALGAAMNCLKRSMRRLPGVSMALAEPVDELDAAIASMQADTDLERIKQERDQAVEALREGRRAIGDHIAPNDCYTTGPLTGDDYRDLVECPACSFIAMYDKALGGQHD